MPNSDNSIKDTYRSAAVNFVTNLPWFVALSLAPAAIYFGITSYTVEPSVDTVVLQNKDMIHKILISTAMELASSLVFTPILLSAAIVVTKKERTGSVLSNAVQHYPWLFLLGLVWIPVFTVGNILIVPGVIFFLLTLFLINPIRWLEDKKSALQALTAPWLSFLLPSILFLIWFVCIQFITIVVWKLHGEYPYLTVLIKIAEQLLWSFVLVAACQVWRLGMSLEADAG